MKRDLALFYAESAVRFIQAKIVLPPRKLEPYYKGFKKKIERFLSDVAALDKIWSPLDKGFSGSGGYEVKPFDDWVIETSSGTVYPDDVPYILSRFIRPSYGAGKSEIAFNLELADDAFRIAKKATDGRESLDWIKKLSESVERVADDIDKVMESQNFKALSSGSWLDKTWADYTSEYGQVYQGLVEEGVPRVEKKDLKALEKVVKDAIVAQKFAKDASARIKQIYDAAYGKHYKSDWKPESSDVETLYHASVDAKKIFRKGFDPRVPEEKGLGGSQSDKRGKPAISFTSDLYVAKEVMRGLKEAIMIAKGQVKMRHVFEWAKKAGVGKAIMTSVKINKYKDDPHGVMLAYREFMMHQRKRYNPLFFGNMKELMKKLKTMNHRNVGVLVAQVNMDHEDIVYYSNMQEYRVPPSAVVSIDKLIS